MATARRRTSTRSGSSRSSSASRRRSAASYERELEVVRGELSRVDAIAARRRSAVAYGQTLLVFVALLALFYVFLLHLRYGAR